MRTSLIIFGVIFLVIGGLLYYIPRQQIRAYTTTTGNGDTDTRTSSASVTVPAGWAYASAIIGFVLLLLGLVIPGPSLSVPTISSDSKKDSYEKVVKSREDVKDSDGNKRKMVSKRTEKVKVRNDEDDL